MISGPEGLGTTVNWLECNTSGTFKWGRNKQGGVRNHDNRQRKATLCTSDAFFPRFWPRFRHRTGHSAQMFLLCFRKLNQKTGKTVKCFCEKLHFVADCRESHADCHEPFRSSRCTPPACVLQCFLLGWSFLIMVRSS